MAVLHAEAAGDGAELDEAQTLIQVARMRVAGDDSVELQHAEAVRPALPQAVGHERFARVQAARGALDRVAGVADMAAATDIVRVQDIEPDHLSARFFDGDRAVCLRGEKLRAGGLVQQLLLREGHAVLHDLIPNTDHRRQIARRVRPHFQFHKVRPISFFIALL